MLNSLSLNDLLRIAHLEVFAYGRILTDTAAKLMTHGCEVERLEERLINNQTRAAQ